MNRFSPLSITRSTSAALALLVAVALSGCDIFGSAQDLRAPTVSIQAPFDGATLSGANARVIVSAAPRGDGNYVSFINVNLDGVRIGEAEWDGNQYVFPFNTREATDGLHRIEAVAFDANQARGVSDPVTVRIRNVSAGPGPELFILQPENAAEVEGTVRILARTAPGQPVVTRVEFLIDGIPLFATDTPQSGDAYLFDWNTAGQSIGMHTIEVKGYSGEDAFRLSAPVKVNLISTGGDDPGGEPGDAQPGQIIFKAASFSGEVRGAAAVGFNDDIYVGSTSDTLYAFDQEGTPRWTFGARGPIRSSVVVGNNEDIFFTSEDGHLYGLNSQGKQLWTPYPQTIPTSVLRTTPALGIDAVLYFGDSDGRLHAVNTFNGQSVAGWPINLATASIVVPPAIARDRTVIVAATDGYVYAVAPDGSRLWKSTRNLGATTVGMALAERQLTVTLPTGEIRRSSTVVVYLVSNDGNVYALAGEDGSILWEYTLTGPMRSGPIVGPDGTIYVGTSTGLFALNEEADAFSPRLRFIHPVDDVGTPAIDSNGVIYFVSGKRVIALNPNNTPLWTYELGTEADGPVTINREGQLLVSGRNGLIYAIETGSNGLAQGKWPTYGRNARNTSRLGIDQTDG